MSTKCSCRNVNIEATQYVYVIHYSQFSRAYATPKGRLEQNWHRTAYTYFRNFTLYIYQLSVLSHGSQKRISTIESRRGSQHWHAADKGEEQEREWGLFPSNFRFCLSLWWPLSHLASPFRSRVPTPKLTKAAMKADKFRMKWCIRWHLSAISFHLWLHIPVRLPTSQVPLYCWCCWAHFPSWTGVKPSPRQPNKVSQSMLCKAEMIQNFTKLEKMPTAQEITSLSSILAA